LNEENFSFRLYLWTEKIGKIANKQKSAKCVEFFPLSGIKKEAMFEEKKLFFSIKIHL